MDSFSSMKVERLAPLIVAVEERPPASWRARLNVACASSYPRRSLHPILRSKPYPAEGWLFELKYDGFRAFVRRAVFEALQSRVSRWPSLGSAHLRLQDVSMLSERNSPQTTTAYTPRQHCAQTRIPPKIRLLGAGGTTSHRSGLTEDATIADLAVAAAALIETGAQSLPAPALPRTCARSAARSCGVPTGSNV